MSMENFIGVYDNALSVEKCDYIIDWFESNNQLWNPGECGSDDRPAIDTSIKDSMDISLNFNDSDEISKIIFFSLKDAVHDYMERYKIPTVVGKFSNDPHYNVQRYLPGQGYFAEHCEHDHGSSTRILAWTLYLNDVTDGGETYYTRYDLRCESRAGRMVIFPAYWTHAHHGIVSNTQTKYIATGWFYLHDR